MKVTGPVDDGAAAPVIDDAVDDAVAGRGADEFMSRSATSNRSCSEAPDLPATSSCCTPADMDWVQRCFLVFFTRDLGARRAVVNRVKGRRAGSAGEQGDGLRASGPALDRSAARHAQEPSDVAGQATGFFSGAHVAQRQDA
jgi:hypothetical protein